MQQEPNQKRMYGIPILTETGYQVMEGPGALVNRNSLFFTAGQGISLIGDGFYFATLIIWITTITTAAAQTPAQKVAVAATITAFQAALYGVAYLANFLVIPFVGVFVDRWNRRTTMILADLAQAVLTLLPLGAFFVDKAHFLPTLYMSYFVLIAAQGFFAGSKSGVLQVIVARKNVPQVVSILNILLGIGGIAGAIYAPLFFLSVGPVVAIVVNAASFLVSALALIFLRVPREALHPYAYRQNHLLNAPERAGERIRQVLRDLQRGLRFVFSSRVLFGIAIMVIFANAGAAAINAVATGFFFANLHADPVNDLKILGLLPASFGIGSITGALLVGVLVKFVRLKVLALVGILGAGIGLIVMAFQTSIPSGLLSFVLTGIFTGTFTVSYGSLILRITPNPLIGRVDGILTSLATFSAFITAFVVSAIVQADNPVLNPRTPFPDPTVLFMDVFLVAGALVILSSLVGYLFVRKASEEVVKTTGATITPRLATLVSEEGNG